MIQNVPKSILQQFLHQTGLRTDTDMIILYDWFIPFPISSAFRTILWHMVKIHWTGDIGPLFKITRQFELEIFYFLSLIIQRQQALERQLESSTSNVLGNTCKQLYI